MPRRVSLTRTVKGPKGDVTVPRTDVWPLTASTVGYVQNRGGVATARYNRQYKSLRMPFTAKNKAAAVKAAEAWVLEQLAIERAGGAASVVPRMAAAIPGAQVVTLMSAFRQYEVARLNERGDAKERARHRDAWRAFRHFVPVDEALTDESARRLTADGIRLLRDGDGTPEHPARSANTVLSYATRWRPFMSFCRASGWITVEPLGLVRLPKPETKESALTYSDDDLARLDAHFAAMADGNGNTADAEGYRLLWRFLALSGCRIMEALNLTPEDLHETHIELRLTKRGRPRVVPLAPFPDLAALCREIRERAVRLDIRRGRDIEGRSGKGSPTGTVKLFPSTKSEQCAKQLRPALAALGIDGGAHPHHVFRATAINRWEVMGIPEAVRDRLSGHSRGVGERHYNARKSAAQLVQMIAAAGVPIAPSEGDSVP